MGRLSILETISTTREAFRNWPTVGFVAGIASPSLLPPRRGFQRINGPHVCFKTRMGPILCTDASNAAPIVEVFRNREYDLGIDWSGIELGIDVGAHVGAFTCWLASKASRARIISFEPEPRNFRDLVENVDRNGLKGRVDLINAAVDDAPGTRVLDVPVQRDSASLASSQAPASTPVKVRTVALQDVLHDLNARVDILKIDCEGSEWDILPSLTSESWIRIERVVLECHLLHRYVQDDAVAILREAGFDGIDCLKVHQGDQRLGKIILLHAYRQNVVT